MNRYHESSVGAGLPIISTLNDLIATGDEVQKIEGVFSGTISFLFNSFAPVEGNGGKWSEEVAKAKAAGFTYVRLSRMDWIPRPILPASLSTSIGSLFYIIISDHIPLAYLTIADSTFLSESQTPAMISTAKT